jgi:hypothetical protein
MHGWETLTAMIDTPRMSCAPERFEQEVLSTYVVACSRPGASVCPAALAAIGEWTSTI